MKAADAPEVMEINGQDWAACMDGSRHEGAVKAAVDEFATKYNVQVLLTYRDTPWNTWIIQKP